MTSTASDGDSFVVRPIGPADLDHIVLRCWPDRTILDRLFAEQGTIGMAAWEGDTCVGLLHCYRVVLPDGRNDDWPDNGGNWWVGEKAWTEWQKWGPRMPGFALTGPAWCHGCCHVGRTLEVEATDDPDPRYYGRGIGTSLGEASVRWARERDYVAVLAPGAPDGLFEFAVWAGHLPWTTYAKLGFETVDAPVAGEELPAWAQGDSPPEVMSQVRDALAAGRPACEIRERLMLLDLTRRNSDR